MKRRDPRDWVERFSEDSCVLSDRTGDEWLVNPFMYLALVGIASFVFCVELVQIVWDD